MEHYQKIFLLNAFINPITAYTMFHRCVIHNKNNNNRKELMCIEGWYTVVLL